MERKHNPLYLPRLQLSLVIPVINEGNNLPVLLHQLQQLSFAEVIFVDGGSSDNTKALIQEANFVLLTSKPGRGQQLNAGAAIARGDVLVFLHADTVLPVNVQQLITASLQTSKPSWGRFDVIIDGPGPLYRIIAVMMNWRSRLTGIATGDQVMFMHRSLFEAVGGFADIPLMEDVELSKRLKQHQSPICLTERVVTSGRRWQKNGVIKTMVLMWWLRLAFWVGVSPDRLARWYRGL